MLVDGNGVPKEKCEYDPFGGVRVFTWNNGTGTWNSAWAHASSVGNPYLFTGRRFDAETRLGYYRNRYYSRELGRYLTGDLIGPWDDCQNTGSPYAYNGNNPVDRSDPFGLYTVIIINIRGGGDPQQQKQIEEFANNRAAADPDGGIVIKYDPETGKTSAKPAVGKPNANAKEQKSGSEGKFEIEIFTEHGDIVPDEKNPVGSVNRENRSSSPHMNYLCGLAPYLTWLYIYYGCEEASVRVLSCYLGLGTKNPRLKDYEFDNGQPPNNFAEDLAKAGVNLTASTGSVDYGTGGDLNAGETVRMGPK
jgi:RHS repeat-associated protein